LVEIIRLRFSGSRAVGVYWINEVRALRVFGKMAAQVERVESVANEKAICVVRCLAGIITVGSVFNTTIDECGEPAQVAVRVDRIWRYGRYVELLDPVRTARLQISGQRG
jgi:hypothetical protein